MYLYPFRLGIITDEVSQDLSEAISFAHKYSMEAIELRSVHNRVVTQLSDEEIEDIRNLVDPSDLKICALSTPIFKCNLNVQEELDTHYNMAKRAIEIAKKLDVAIIRGFSFWAKESFEAAFPDILKQFRRIIPLFEQAEITFALEFDPSVYASNARKVSLLLDAINSPYIRALYDPGNSVWDEEGEVPYPDGYEYLKGLICHIHLKDVRITPEGPVAVAIGTGQVDYKSLFRRLLQDGYTGYLVLETHYRLKTKLTEEQLKRPGGNTFSIGGKEASEECASYLLQLLNDVIGDSQK